MGHSPGLSATSTTRRRPGAAAALAAADGPVLVGGRGAGLFARDAARRTGNIHYQVGTDPRYGQMYFDEYINLDPMGAAYLTLGVGEARIYNIASFLDPNSMRPAFTRNGTGCRAGATTSWSRWTRPGRASPASRSSSRGRWACRRGGARAPARRHSTPAPRGDDQLDDGEQDRRGCRLRRYPRRPSTPACSWSMRPGGWCMPMPAARSCSMSGPCCGPVAARSGCHRSGRPIRELSQTLATVGDGDPPSASKASPCR